MRKHSLAALLVAVGAALTLGAASARADDAPGLTMSFSTAPLMLVDGQSVVIETTATCVAPPWATYAEGGMYLGVLQGPVDNPTGAAHGDAGPLICDGLPHTYTSVASPLSPALQLRPGHARLTGTIYVWTDTGDLFGDGPFEAETMIVGSPVPRPEPAAPPVTDFGFQLEAATIDRGGGVSVTFTATCSDATYTGDYVGGDVRLEQKSLAGLATGRGENWQQPLICDGAAHSYSLGIVRPDDPSHPFRAGRADAVADFAITDAEWSWVTGYPEYSSSVDLRGGAPPPTVSGPDLEVQSVAATVGKDGAVSVTFTSACDPASVYSGALMSSWYALTQKTAAGIATGFGGSADWSTLVCDGTPHTYSGGTSYPADPGIPFHAGQATAAGAIDVVTPEWGWLGEFAYSSAVLVKG